MPRVKKDKVLKTVNDLTEEQKKEYDLVNDSISRLTTLEIQNIYNIPVHKSFFYLILAGHDIADFCNNLSNVHTKYSVAKAMLDIGYTKEKIKEMTHIDNNLNTKENLSYIVGEIDKNGLDKYLYKALRFLINPDNSPTILYRELNIPEMSANLIRYRLIYLGLHFSKHSTYLRKYHDAATKLIEHRSCDKELIAILTDINLSSFYEYTSCYQPYLKDDTELTSRIHRLFKENPSILHQLPVITDPKPTHTSELLYSRYLPDILAWRRKGKSYQYILTELSKQKGVIHLTFLTLNYNIKLLLETHKQDLSDSDAFALLEGADLETALTLSETDDKLSTIMKNKIISFKKRGYSIVTKPNKNLSPAK